MPTLEKVYALHQVLKSRKYPVSEAVLMEELDCSRSTLFRTIQVLRNRFGAPIENRKGQGFFYANRREEFELPGIWFRARELEALLVVHHLISELQPGILDERIGHLRSKVAQLLDQSSAALDRSFPTERFRILASHARKLADGVFELAAQSLIERHQLEFTYAGRSDESESRRSTSPQRLVHYKDHWYLDAWDEHKEGLRTFALDRMREVRVMEINARDIREHELDEALTHGYGLFAGPVVGHAKLVFSEERAGWVSEENWHPDQVGRFRKDGTYELVVPYSAPSELLGEILRHGPHVRVDAPEALVQIVRESLADASKLYI